MKWDCLEPLAAIGCGLAVCATPVDGGITAALVGGAGLLARFKAGRAKAGLDDAKLIEKMRIAVIRDWERDGQPQEERDAVALAATAMGKHLADCLPTREALAATALQGEGVYPAAAARLVVDLLAERDALFAGPEGGAGASIARRFALDVVERSLRQAKDDPDYAPLLTLDLVIEIAGGVGRIEREQATQTALLEKILAAVEPEARAQSVTDEALIELARRIAAKVADAGEALDELRRAIDEFIRLRERAAQGTNLGDLVDEALRRIAAANERGELDEGARESEQAFTAWREQQEAARQAGLRLIEANIEQHRLRFDAEAMARWIAERLALENGGVIDFQTLRAERARWHALGRDRGLRLELDMSIELARVSVVRAKSAAERASTRNDLAIALAVQGERTGGEAGLALLTEAVAEFRAALAVRTKLAMPTHWSMTQNNLGNALKVLGERTGGRSGLILLSEAVAAFRAALTVRTKAAMPAEWATTTSNLGVALRVQGDRTGGDAGLVLLGEAVAAYRAALTVHDEATMPADWALTQSNLGAALQVQSEQLGGDTGLALLGEAIAAYRAALTVLTESTLPARWATTQSNLGAALGMQGERTADNAGLALLAEAVVAFRAALTVRTESAMPADWAMTQNNLGNALSEQGERTEGDAGLASLDEAIVAYRAALTVWTREHFSYYYDVAQRNLGRTLALIAARGG